MRLGGMHCASRCRSAGLHAVSVSFSDANTGIVVGAAGTILRTTDGGGTWKAQSSGTGRSLFGVFLRDANTGTVVGDTGTILRTTTGGEPPESRTAVSGNARF